MNKRTTKQKLHKKWKNLPDEPTAEKGSDARHLLKEGTKVRVILEAPQGVQGQKLHGKFRASVLVRDVAFIKELTIIYSTDDWKTQSTANGDYSSHVNTWNGTTVWDIHLTLEKISKIEFAICFKVFFL